MVKKTGKKKTLKLKTMRGGGGGWEMLKKNQPYGDNNHGHNQSFLIRSGDGEQR